MSKQEFRFDISQDVSMLFGTLLVVHDWPDSDELNEALAESLLTREKSNEGTRRSNAGGWQSSGNLIKWEELAIKTLKRRIDSIAANLIDQLIRDTGKSRSFRYVIDAWGNINRTGDYNIVHAHPNCMWSGVYYIIQGDPDTSIPQNGMLELFDPRDAANYIQIQHTIFDAKQFIENIPGRMVMWPSWLKHMVHPFKGDSERISIAFNVNVVEELQ
jgi:uncharacterized protein (TIGR02466 family)